MNEQTSACKSRHSVGRLGKEEGGYEEETSDVMYWRFKKRPQEEETG